MAARRTGLTLPLPLQFLAAWLGVWLGRVRQEQVDFLKAENRLLREKLGTKRIRLTDAERRRLATLGLVDGALNKPAVGEGQGGIDAEVRLHNVAFGIEHRQWVGIACGDPQVGSLAVEIHRLGFLLVNAA